MLLLLDLLVSVQGQRSLLRLRNVAREEIEGSVSLERAREERRKKVVELKEEHISTSLGRVWRDLVNRPREGEVEEGRGMAVLAQPLDLRWRREWHLRRLYHRSQHHINDILADISEYTSAWSCIEARFLRNVVARSAIFVYF